MRNWPPMTRVSRPYCTATRPARNVACRHCALAPWPVKMTTKTTIMPPRNLKSNAMAAAVRAPRLGQIADGLAAAVAVSLPWSTSATSILIVLWIIAVVPTLDVASVRREVMSPAGGLPVLLWTLGAVGMLWADVSWSERIAGLSGFHKLLVIPLLLAQFRRSPHANWVILGFLASSSVACWSSRGRWCSRLGCRGAAGIRRAGQELHPAERDLCDLRVRTVRASRRNVAHSHPPRCDAPCSCGGVHRQYRLCGDGAYHPRGPGGDGGTVRAAAVRLERRGWCLPGRRGAGRGGVGILALSACARFGGGRAGAKLWHQRRRHPGRLAARILEEIACLRRRSTCYRAWDGNDSCAVPARCDRRDDPVADNDQPAQPRS